MVTIVTRAGKGSPLTNTEVDANFTNLNSGKAESASPALTGNLTLSGNATLGDASTDTVQVNGYMGVGVAPSANVGVFTRPSALTTASQYGVLGGVLANASATTLAVGVMGEGRTAATAFTVDNLAALYANNSTRGAGSTITNQHGVYIADQTQGTNNYGITSLVSSGTNKWNIYASGTAANYFAGNVGIGTNSPAFTLDVIGRVAASTDYLLRDTGGTARSVLTIDSNDDLLLQTGTTTGTRSVVLKTEGAERMRIDSSGNLLIGTTSAASTQGAPLQVITAIAARRNIATTGGPAFRFEKSRATTDETYTIVANGDTLGEQQFYGADGVQYIIGASVKAVVDGTPGTNDMPTALVLSTTADGASSVTERMRIDSSGNINIATAGARITGDFSNATVANRVAFQTSTLNGATQTAVIPNGSGTVANCGFFNNSDITNAAGFFVGTANSGTEARLNSTITGTGTYLPMTFYTGGSERMRVDTSGNVGIGNTPSGTYKLEVSGLVSDTAGNLRSLPLNSQTAAYIVAATDNGKVISITTGGVTVNNSIMSAGMVVTVYNNSASSQTITQGTGVTLQWAGQGVSTTGNRTLGLYGMATILFLSASSAVITGSGLT